MNLIKTSALIVIFGFASVMISCSDNDGQTGGQVEEQQTQDDETASPAPPAGDSGMEQQTAQPGDTNQQPPAENAPGQAQMQSGQTVEIAGKVEKTDGGYLIRSVDETYQVQGRDLEDMVGQDVKVRGTLEDVGGQQAIRVSEVTPIQ